MSDETSDVRLGVILHPQREPRERLLAGFAAALRERGTDVGGLVQRTSHDADGDLRMELTDLRTGRIYVISEKLGPGSSACCLSAPALIEASQVLRREIEAPPALLVVSKFAGLEAEGRGLAPDMFEAVSRGIPVLTTLASHHKPRWDTLAGGVGTMLPAEEEALWRWWEGTK